MTDLRAFPHAFAWGPGWPLSPTSGYTGVMNNALFYLLISAGMVVVAGLVVLYFAMRSAPEGFESQEEGFVGLTKGDEMLLNEFAAQRAALLNAGVHAAA